MRIPLKSVRLLVLLAMAGVSACLAGKPGRTPKKEAAMAAPEIAFTYMTTLANGTLGQVPAVCHLIASAAQWKALHLPEELTGQRKNADSLLASVDFAKQSVLALTWNGGNGYAVGLIKLHSDAKGTEAILDVRRPDAGTTQMGYTSTVVHLYKVDAADLPDPITFTAHGKTETLTVLRHR